MRIIKLLKCHIFNKHDYKIISYESTPKGYRQRFFCPICGSRKVKIKVIRNIPDYSTMKFREI